MAAGPATSWLLEVELTPGSGTYVNVTADLDGGVAIHQGRSSQFDDAQPGTLSFTLSNVGGTYTPESATATRSLRKGLKVRYSIVKSAVTYWRFRGRIKTADATSLEPGQTAVAVSCVDGLGAMQARTLRYDWEEYWAYRSRTETCDVFAMDDTAAATSIRNAGSGTAIMTVRPAATGTGSYERGSVSQGLLLPGQITLTPSDAGIGPVLAVDLKRAVGTGVITFAVQSTATPAADLVLVTGLTAAGSAVWTVRLHTTGGHTALTVYDEIASTHTTLKAELDGSDKWMACSVYDDGAQSVWFVNNGDDGASYATPRNNNVRYAVLGGYARTWKLLGKQGYCPPMAVAGVAASATTHSDTMDHTRPLVTTSAGTRANELISSYCGLTGAGIGSLVPNVTRTNTSGRSALDCINQVVGTVGGMVWHDYPTNAITWTWPDSAKPVTSAATITLEQDDDITAAAMVWSAPGDTTPTRVTVSSAAGSKTAVNAYAEQVLGLQQEETWDSCAADDVAAGALAGARLNRAIGARIPQVAVDLVTASNDRYAAILALAPGNRVTVAGLPSTLLGVTTLDAYVMGWTETWATEGGAPSAVLTFDLVLADKPSELRLDDSTYGRLAAGESTSGVPLMTVTSGTAVGGTGNGTMVVTTASGPTLSTAAGSYPLDLDWAGERVTITSAPAGSGSPQTVTTTTRGKTPTVARSHSAGDPVDVWMPATIAGV